MSCFNLERSKRFTRRSSLETQNRSIYLFYKGRYRFGVDFGVKFQITMCQDGPQEGVLVDLKYLTNNNVKDGLENVILNK